MPCQLVEHSYPLIQQVVFEHPNHARILVWSSLTDLIGFIIDSQVGRMGSEPRSLRLVFQSQSHNGCDGPCLSFVRRRDAVLRDEALSHELSSRIVSKVAQVCPALPREGGRLPSLVIRPLFAILLTPLLMTKPPL